jgi:hypothetical protein
MGKGTALAAGHPCSAFDARSSRRATLDAESPTVIIEKETRT